MDYVDDDHDDDDDNEDDDSCFPPLNPFPLDASDVLLDRFPL